MTLNVTVISPHYAFQCADYQLTSTAKNSSNRQKMQKIFALNHRSWCATLCFSGVAKYGTINVRNWIVEKISEIDFDDPFDVLLKKIRTADIWLQSVPHPHNRHSFSVGAFVSGKPVYVLISNYENSAGVIRSRPSRNLVIHRLEPTKTKTRIFVSGQPLSVSRTKRKKIEKLTDKCTAPKKVHLALAKLNNEVALNNPMVSKACFSMHVKATGESSGYSHHSDESPSTINFTTCGEVNRVINDTVEKHFGKKKYSLSEIHSASWDSSDEYHKIQLREKSMEPDVHNNYGAFLANDGRFSEARRRFMDAVSLELNHIPTLLNLANLEQEEGNQKTAIIAFRKILRLDPGNEVASLKYCGYLMKQNIKNLKIFNVLDLAISMNPNSGKLYLQRARMNLKYKKYAFALEDFKKAREYGADQKLTETGYALSLAFCGEPTTECILAYRTALALNPTSPSLKINLALQLANKGYIDEAELHMTKVMKSKKKNLFELEDTLILIPDHIRSMSGMMKKLEKVMIAQFGKDCFKMVNTHKVIPLKNEDYYKLFLSKNPYNVEALINYGNYLCNNNNKALGKAKFEEVLGIEPNNINGLENLAFLAIESGDFKTAEALFKQILKTNPSNENTIRNYFTLAKQQSGDYAQALEILTKRINAEPKNSRLLVLRAEYYLTSTLYNKAKADFLTAKRLGTKDNRIEAGLAQTLHLTRAPIVECINAYKVAISTLDSGGLKLNLAQLLFLHGEADEAEELLFLAEDSILDGSAQIERQFYLLAHTSSDIAECIQTIKSLIEEGNRLNWDVTDNIKLESQSSDKKAIILETLVNVLQGEGELSLLKNIQAELSSLIDG